MKVCILVKIVHLLNDRIQMYYFYMYNKTNDLIFRKRLV